MYVFILQSCFACRATIKQLDSIYEEILFSLGGPQESGTIKHIPCHKISVMCLHPTVEKSEGARIENAKRICNNITRSPEISLALSFAKCKFRACGAFSSGGRNRLCASA